MSSKVFIHPDYKLDLSKAEQMIESITNRFYVPYSIIKLLKEGSDSEQELSCALKRIDDLESSMSQLTSLSKIALENLKKQKGEYLIETRSLGCISIKSKKSKADILPYMEKLKDLIKNLNAVVDSNTYQAWRGGSHELMPGNARLSGKGYIELKEIEGSGSEEFEVLLIEEEEKKKGEEGDEDEVRSTVSNLLGTRYPGKFSTLREILIQAKEKTKTIEQLEAERDSLFENVEYLESKTY